MRRVTTNNRLQVWLDVHFDHNIGQWLPIDGWLHNLYWTRKHKPGGRFDRD